VSFKNGRPDRANYRRFRIKTVEGQDDFGSMAEVVRRRYTRVLNENGRTGVAPAQKSKDDDAGEAVPEDLQKLINETGRKVKRGIPVKPGNEDRGLRMEDGKRPEQPSSPRNPA